LIHAMRLVSALLSVRKKDTHRIYIFTDLLDY
jgi:hypothetical protein